jgi:hypothetical protein
VAEAARTAAMHQANQTNDQVEATRRAAEEQVRQAYARGIAEAEQRQRQQQQQQPAQAPPQQPPRQPPTASTTPTNSQYGNLQGKPPKLKNFKVIKFTGKETYVGLGCNFNNWLKTFLDAIQRDIVFEQSIWTEEHKYHALKASLSDEALQLVTDKEDQWKASYPQYSFDQLVERLSIQYETHLSQDQLIHKMQVEKRWTQTWNDHAQYLRYLQLQCNVSNSTILDMFCRHACPTHTNALITKSINSAEKIQTNLMRSSKR